MTAAKGLTPHFKIIEQFEAENPDIQVQLEPVGSGDYYARILTQIAAGDPPDLLQIGDDAVPMFVDKGAFVPLDDFIASADYPLDTSIYLPGVLEPGKWKGSQYLLPKDFSPMAVYYNKKLFDEAGVAYPTRGLDVGRLAGDGAGADQDRCRRQRRAVGHPVARTVDDRLRVLGRGGRRQPDQRGRHASLSATWIRRRCRAPCSSTPTSTTSTRLRHRRPT